MQLAKIMSSRRKRTVAIKKERNLKERLWNEIRTLLFNTVLMFSRTLLLPVKEICTRDSCKYLQMIESIYKQPFYQVHQASIYH